MSTQDNVGIPFGIDHDQQSFRLIELPPTLLARVRSENPPTLYLKSETQNSSAANASAGNAFLCTDNQTYEVRQVQSSNALYILNPSVWEGQSVRGVSVIGECKAKLELVDVSTAATAFLKRNVPVYDKSAFEPYGHTTKKCASREALLADAPFSEGEFDAAWTDLCIFESNKQFWRPWASTLEEFWQSLMNAVTMERIDFESTFFIRQIGSMLEEDGFSEELAVAIFRRIGPEYEPDDPIVTLKLEREKCVPWLGALVLQTSTLARPIDVSSFMAKWRNQLPENWRSDADLDRLQGAFKLHENEQIRFIDKDYPPREQAKPALAVKDAKGPNKWHERFKLSR